MSKKFLVPIDLNQLEIQNVRLQNLATAPGSPVAGQMYYNTTTNKAMVYNGSTWIPWEADTNSVTGVKGNLETSYRTGNVNLTPANIGAAPTSHASTATTYGVGNASNYGHVKLSDSTTATTAASGGTAATPKAVSDALAAAKSYADGLDTGVSDVTVNGVSIVSSGVAALVNATSSTSGLMSNSDKTKLDGIATGAEANMFSINGDAEVEIGEISEGNNVQLSYDSNSEELIISATDTTYSAGTAALLEAGTDTSNRVWQAKILYDYIASTVGAADAMRFKGTIGTGGDVTSLPTSGVRVGDTYRVITAGTYAGQTCEIGDLIIATATTPTWTVAQTNIDGAITSISGTAPISVTGSGASRTVSISAATTSAAGSMSADDKTKLNGIAEGATANTGTVTQVASGTGLTGGPITTTGTLSLATVYTTAPGAKGDTSAQTPGFGSTFKVPSMTVDQYGRVTAVADHTVTIPNTVASTSAAGLMSETDKSNLSAIVNNHLAQNVVTLTAGQTSVPAPQVDDVVSYTAIDKTTHEEVVVDYSTAGTNGAAGVFSIAAAYSNDIEIRCACYE